MNFKYLVIIGATLASVSPPVMSMIMHVVQQNEPTNQLLRQNYTQIRTSQLNQQTNNDNTTDLDPSQSERGQNSGRRWRHYLCNFLRRIRHDS